MIPVVELNSFKLSDNYYTNDEYTWDVATLILYCKEKNYPVFDLPLVAVPIGEMPLTIDNFKEFVTHCKRVQDADLQYPIILGDDGSIIDGYHRIAKAILNGDSTIKALRIQEMPSASGKVDKPCLT